MSSVPSSRPAAATTVEWTEAPAATSLLEVLLDGPQAGDRGTLSSFLGAADDAAALRAWMASRLGTGTLPTLERLKLLLGHDLAEIERLLAEQVNAILHHPRFQQLEASWRGLQWLSEHLDDSGSIRLRALNISWKEVSRDIESAIEFDQSQLFRKVYSEEFGTPGGEPFGLLIGDYFVRHRPSAEHRVDDVVVLRGIAQVAAAAFAPFVAGVDPAVFGIESFRELERPLNLPRTFDNLEHLAWNSLREAEDSRFLGLTLPRMLLRSPLADDGSRDDGFRFSEDAGGGAGRPHLWGNAAYGFAAVVMRAFADTGWLADIRGTGIDSTGGGLLTTLPGSSFETDRTGRVPKANVDVQVSDTQEPELADLGYIPLCHCPDTPFSIFYSTQSLQKVKRYDDPLATASARMSAQLQYMLCVARFAHYIKVIARDKIGALGTAEELQRFLHNWLHRYVTADPNASVEVRTERPLREAQVEVTRHPSRPGAFFCVARLAPHYQLDQMTASLRLVTELAPQM